MPQKGTSPHGGNRFGAVALVAAILASTGPPPLAAQQSTTLSGTAKDEAKHTYSNYIARARDVSKDSQGNGGGIGDSTSLDAQVNFSLTDLQPMVYLVELVDKNGKVVCTKGPFDLRTAAIRSDIVINCDRKKSAWWLLGAAAAAGITAGVLAAGPASPSR